MDGDGDGDEAAAEAEAEARDGDEGVPGVDIDRVAPLLPAHPSVHVRLVRPHLILAADVVPQAGHDVAHEQQANEEPEERDADLQVMRVSESGKDEDEGEDGDKEDMEDMDMDKDNDNNEDNEDNNEDNSEDINKDNNKDKDININIGNINISKLATRREAPHHDALEVLLILLQELLDPLQPSHPRDLIEPQPRGV